MGSNLCVMPRELVLGSYNLRLPLFFLFLENSMLIDLPFVNDPEIAVALQDPHELTKYANSMIDELQMRKRMIDNQLRLWFQIRDQFNQESKRGYT